MCCRRVSITQCYTHLWEVLHNSLTFTVFCFGRGCIVFSTLSSIVCVLKLVSFHLQRRAHHTHTHTHTLWIFLAHDSISQCLKVLSFSCHLCGYTSNMSWFSNTHNFSPGCTLQFLSLLSRNDDTQQLLSPANNSLLTIIETAAAVSSYKYVIYFFQGRLWNIQSIGFLCAFPGYHGNRFVA